MTNIFKLLIAVLALSLPSQGLAQAAAVDPKLAQLVPGNPNPDGFIHDGTGVLDAGAKSRLNERITQVQRTIRGDIGVAIMADIKDYQPYEMATAIYRTWGIGTRAPVGNARRDVGVLILLVPKEKAPNNKGHCWLAPGIGAEGVLTDSRAGEICRGWVIPEMKVMNYEAAVNKAIDAIMASFQGLDPLTTEGAASILPPGLEAQTGWGFMHWLMMIILGALTLLLSAFGIGRYQRYKPRECPLGHGKMGLVVEDQDDRFLKNSDQLEENLGSVDYDVWKCKRCPETIVIPRKKWMSSYADCPKCKCLTLNSQTRTITAATQLSTGLEEQIDECEFCDYRAKSRRETPMLPTPSSSSSGSGFSSGGSGGGSSFGGSGSSSGGGGGGSY